MVYLMENKMISTEKLIEELLKYPGLYWAVAASVDDSPFTGLASSYTGDIGNAQAFIYISDERTEATPQKTHS